MLRGHDFPAEALRKNAIIDEKDCYRLANAGKNLADLSWFASLARDHLLKSGGRGGADNVLSLRHATSSAVKGDPTCF